MLCRRSNRIEKRNQLTYIPVTNQVLEKVNKIKHNRSETFNKSCIDDVQSKTKRRRTNSSVSIDAVLEHPQITCYNAKNKARLTRSKQNFSSVETTNDEETGSSSLKRGLVKFTKTSIKEVSASKSLIEEANEYLIQVEPKLKPIIEQNFCQLFSPEGLLQEVEPFAALTNSIISQQVSSAAAKSIKKKFISLFNRDNIDATKYLFPTPSLVSASSIETLKTAGLTQRKAEYIKGLAAKFDSGELNKAMLFSASYDDIFSTLIKIRGLGKWSIEMFACFCLKKTDIFSTQDIGIQRGMAILLGRDVAKLKKMSGKWRYITEKEMEEMANRFKPYRSIFMWYIWRIEETSVSALED
ncbi:DNA-3-methyladenine glycosylase [Erysiphe neolycopersici]|uniref:DNA-3-methyladenine glycosylase n=1 Tax=Erysiphe neolycopersici TaxID=212602 RepID=A0A420HX88_9PEZI|nr:DNA-3-methyladenine glycosylase [Erysiphe neolycopersici]